MTKQVSDIFDPSVWEVAPGAEGYTDITAHLSLDGRIARVAFDRPEVRNAFRPHTVDELFDALDRVRVNPKVGVVLLTGNGPSAKDGGWAFCSGGDQRIRGRDGYKYSESETAVGPEALAACGPPAHPRGAAAHPLHAEGRHRARSRLGRRRRALAQRGLRPDDRKPRAREV